MLKNFYSENPIFERRENPISKKSISTNKCPQLIKQKSIHSHNPFGKNFFGKSKKEGEKNQFETKSLF